MTIGDKNRKADAYRLLQVLLETLGDTAIDIRLFDAEIAEFKDFLKTSWDELLASELLTVTAVHPNFLYRMTAKGWVEAMIRSELLEDAVTQTRLRQLAAVLKNKVKTRTASVVDLDSLAPESRVPVGWVFNAVDSHLINYKWRKRDAFWLEGARGRLISVPGDFGMTDIDLFDDIRSLNERLQEELAAAKEDGSGFRCPYCLAPLSGRNSVDLDEHTTGIAENFECGYSTVEGLLESPCPSDPEFPKFDDFELRAKHNPRYDQWTCSAVGKTEMATKVHLQVGVGQTEAEAKELVRRYYEFVIGRRKLRS